VGWNSAAMLEAAKGLRRLKAYKQLSALRAALAAHQAKHAADSPIEPPARAA
jgi:putative transposase